MCCNMICKDTPETTGHKQRTFRKGLNFFIDSMQIASNKGNNAFMFYHLIHHTWIFKYRKTTVILKTSKHTPEVAQPQHAQSNPIICNCCCHKQALSRSKEWLQCLPQLKTATLNFPRRLWTASSSLASIFLGLETFSEIVSRLWNDILQQSSVIHISRSAITCLKMRSNCNCCCHNQALSRSKEWLQCLPQLKTATLNFPRRLGTASSSLMSHFLGLRNHQ